MIQFLSANQVAIIPKASSRMDHHTSIYESTPIHLSMHSNTRSIVLDKQINTLRSACLLLRSLFCRAMS